MFALRYFVSLISIGISCYSCVFTVNDSNLVPYQVVWVSGIVYTVSQIKRGYFSIRITFTIVKLFSKFLKLATSQILLRLLMYSNCPPHLNYATTLPCENYNNKIGQF